MVSEIRSEDSKETTYFLNNTAFSKVFQEKVAGCLPNVLKIAIRELNHKASVDFLKLPVKDHLSPIPNTEES